MSTTPPVPAVGDQPATVEYAKAADIQALIKRFETLKKETEDVLNKIAEDGKTLQAECKKLADQVVDITKRLNTAIDEIRSIGGKRLEHVDPAPAQDAKKGLAVTMFEAWED